MSSRPKSTRSPLEIRAERQRRWKHNSFLGFTSMGRMHMRDIIRSDTVTDEARNFARQILADLQALELHLKTRIDP